MSVTINRADLLRALDIAYPTTKQNRALAILSNIKVTIDKDTLVVYAYDGNNSVEASCHHTGFVDEKTEILVNCEKARSVISALSDKSINLSSNGLTMTIAYGCGHIDIPVADITAYPTELPTDNSIAEVMVPCDFLRKAFADADVFADVDDYRPILQGVCLYVKEGELGYCVTDTLKLVHNKIEFNGADDFSVVIPNNKALANAISQGEFCKLVLYENRIELSTCETKISLSLIKGNYPDFKRVIPSSHSISALASVTTLAQCVNRLASSAENKTSMAKFVFSIDGTGVETMSDDCISVKERLQDIQATERIDVGLNIVQMQKIIKTLPQRGNVMLEFNTSSSPIVIKHEDAPNRVILIMPMRLNG